MEVDVGNRYTGLKTFKNEILEWKIKKYRLNFRRKNKFLQCKDKQSFIWQRDSSYVIE